MKLVEYIYIFTLINISEQNSFDVHFQNQTHDSSNVQQNVVNIPITFIKKTSENNFYKDIDHQKTQILNQLNDQRMQKKFVINHKC